MKETNVTEENKHNIHQGQKIYNAILYGGLASLRPRRDNLLQLPLIDSVVFVGSSGSGKSTIQDAVVEASLHDSVLAGRISVPRRIVTRAPRPDDGEGIVYMKVEDLPAKASQKELGLYGIKTMEAGRTEPFGLEKPEHFPVLFANNVVVKKPEDIIYPRSIFETGLIVSIYAPDRIREERLKERSPELFSKKPEEAAYRLSEEERAAIAVPRAHIIVKNFGSYEERSAQDVISLLKLVIPRGE